MATSAPTSTMCFVHVHKCGGTSVKAALRQSLEPRRPDEIVVDLDARAATRQASALAIPNYAFRDQLLAYFLDARQTRAVMGHFRYTESVHAPFLDRVRFVTVLRRPVDRLLSAYFYDRYKDDEHGRIEESLRDFLFDGDEVSLRARVHGERYLLVFRGDGDTEPRVATQRDIDAATRNLERFSLVGALEDLDTFVTRLEEWTDRPVEVGVSNRNPAPVDCWDEVTPELRAAAEEACRPAQIVYERLLDHAAG